MNDAKLLSQALSRNFIGTGRAIPPPLACQENELPEGGLIETHRADPVWILKSHYGTVSWIISITLF